MGFMSQFWNSLKNGFITDNVPTTIPYTKEQLDKSEKIKEGYKSDHDVVMNDNNLSLFDKAKYVSTQNISIHKNVVKGYIPDIPVLAFLAGHIGTLMYAFTPRDMAIDGEFDNIKIQILSDNDIKKIIEDVSSIKYGADGHKFTQVEIRDNIMKEVNDTSLKYHTYNGLLNIQSKVQQGLLDVLDDKIFIDNRVKPLNQNDKDMIIQTSLLVTIENLKKENKNNPNFKLSEELIEERSKEMVEHIGKSIFDARLYKKNRIIHVKTGASSSASYAQTDSEENPDKKVFKGKTSLISSGVSTSVQLNPLFERIGISLPLKVSLYTSTSGGGIKHAKGKSGLELGGPGSTEMGLAITRLGTEGIKFFDPGVYGLSISKELGGGWGVSFSRGMTNAEIALIGDTAEQSRHYSGEVGSKSAIKETDSKEKIYVVRKEDTLFSIAGKHGISVNDLRSYNNLQSNNINLGQTIKIPTQVYTYKEESLSQNEYTVQKGDTLVSIARKMGTSVEILRETNALENSNIYVGKKLYLGGFEEYTYTQNLKAQRYKTAGIHYNSHIVEKGDTLHSLAHRYFLSVDEVKEQNKLTGNSIYIGQHLSFESPVKTTNTCTIPTSIIQRAEQCKKEEESDDAININIMY
jgi:LysM repeat protein